MVVLTFSILIASMILLGGLLAGHPTLLGGMVILLHQGGLLCIFLAIFLQKRKNETLSPSPLLWVGVALLAISQMIRGAMWMLSLKMSTTNTISF
jgi:hypothetical protein